jgi:hypothetical protein
LSERTPGLPACQHYPSKGNRQLVELLRWSLLQSYSMNFKVHR